MFIEQIELLKNEKVKVSDGGKVDLKRFLWNGK